MRRTGWMAAWMVAGGLAASLIFSTAADAAPCWQPPVTGIVVDPFREPACTWCAGNRGIEYRVAPHSPVRSAATGRVGFVGKVAGTRYVVVELPGQRRLTYGRLASSRVRVGDVVVAGTELARTTTEFFFGLRVDGVYVDPAPFIGRLVGRARLVPVDGSEARPAPPAQARCRVAAAGR